MDWHGELDRWQRFGLQVLAVFGGLALLASVVVGLAYAYFIFHFTMIEPLKGDSTERTSAVFAALGIRDTPPDYVYRECDGDDYRSDNRECFRLHLQGGRYCRWWKLERCEPYIVSDLALNDSEKFSKVMDAIVHPCPYLLRSGYTQSYLERDCKADGLWSSPLVVIFKGKDREVTIRID